MSARSTRPAAASPWRFHACALLVCALGVAAAYGNALHDRFVWDDIPLIQQDDRLRSFDRIGHVFSNDFFARSEEAVKYGYYRPIVTLTYLVDRALYGLSPRGFHATNLLLHVLCSVLVYAVGVRVLSLASPAAIAGALLFAVHPVHTESVTWISGRTDVLATAFLLGAWLAHAAAERAACSRARGLRAGGGRALTALAMVLLLLALLSKELAVVFPVLVVLFALGRMPVGRALRAALPYLAVIAGYLVLRFALVQVAANPAVGVPPHVYALTLASTFIRYSAELVWPVPLSAYIQNPWIDAPSPLALLALAGCAGYAVLALALWRGGRRTAARLMLGFAAALGPVSNLVHISGPSDMGFVMAERFLYLPSLFFCLGAGALLALRPSYRYASAAALAGLVAASAAAARARNLDWSDEGLFMQTTIAQARDAPLLHARLGAHYSLAGRHAESIAAFERAHALQERRTGKRDPRLSTDLAAALRRAGRLEEALALLQAVRQSGFAAPSFDFNLGETLRLLGREDEAEMALLRCVQRNRSFTEAHLALARIAAARGRFDEALSRHRTALELSGGDPGIHLAGGDLQRMRGDLKQAERMYRLAIAADPVFARGHAALAAVAAERGDSGAARAGFERALRLSPDLTEAAVALAVLEARGGDLPAAERRLQAALARDPDNVEALLGHATLLARTGRLDQARARVLEVLEREPGNQRARQFAVQLVRVADTRGGRP